uniref:Uncharacterized protein n=1 Tax=Lactuca sativa TaxID=4236 RepID=A0A9R1WVX5_LACSA|nr:hypothetical protein LSAT_V11C800415460 [Lactuca sativa]
MNWTKHGEKEELPSNYVYEEDFQMDTSYFVESTNFTREMPIDVAETMKMVEATDNNFIGDPDKFRELIDYAEKPLYKGFPNFTKNEDEDTTICPTCGKSRWKVDEEKNKIYENIIAKVL